MRFTTLRLKKLAKSFDELSSEYNSVQSELVAKCVEITASYAPVIVQLNELVAQLDVFVSFAHVSMNAPTLYVRPTMLPLVSALYVATGVVAYHVTSSDTNSMLELVLFRSLQFHSLCLQSSGQLSLHGARHPCMEVQENVSFIANDVDMKTGSCAVLASLHTSECVHTCVVSYSHRVSC